MILEKFPVLQQEVQKLTEAEKAELITELFIQLEPDTALFPPSEEELDHMERQLAEYRKDPSVGTPWEEAKKRILGKKP